MSAGDIFSIVLIVSLLVVAVWLAWGATAPSDDDGGRVG